MVLPISFDDVAYYRNEFRGDLIITHGVIYYFPHTRVSAARFSPEIGGKDGAEVIGALGNLIPILSMAPYAHTIADKAAKIGKFLRRACLPSVNSPHIRKLRLWSGRDSSETLQHILDSYIERVRSEPLDFSDEAVPKPLRFSLEEVENISIGLKLRFDAKFDTHDFRVNPIRQSMLRKAIKESGFGR